MHSALRHSGRLSTRIVKRRPRSFHTVSSKLASDWRPEERDPSHSQEPAAKRFDHDGHAKAEAVDATTDRKNGFRRTLRQRRLAEPPKPPPLPAWFLDRNVTLRQRKLDDHDTAEQEQAPEIECVVRKSGEVLFRTSWTEELAALVNIDHSDEPGRADRHPSQDGTTESGTHHDRPVASSAEPASTPDESALENTNRLRQATARSYELDLVNAALIEAEILARATFALAGQNVSTFSASKTGFTLECVDETSHSRLDDLVQTLGHALSADIITLDANDIADLTEDYVGQGNDLPGTFSTLAHDVFEGRHSSKIASSGPSIQGLSFERPFEDDEEHVENDEDEDEIDAEAKDDSNPLHQFKSVGDFVKKRLQDLDQGLGNMPATFSFAVPAGIVVGKSRSSKPQRGKNSSSDYVQWDDARLSALLDQLLDAAKLKRDQKLSPDAQAEQQRWTHLDTVRAPLDPSLPQKWQSRTQHTLSTLLASNRHSHSTLKDLQFQLAAKAGSSDVAAPGSRTIVHLRDVKDICSSKLGDAIVRRLSKVTQKRRRLGQQILLIGTSTGSRHNDDTDDSPFINIIVPPEAEAVVPSVTPDASLRAVGQLIASRGYHRILEVNTRNLWSMLRRMQPEHVDRAPFFFDDSQMLLPGVNLLVERILSQEQAHRIILGAIGISQSYMESDVVQPIHISLATAILAVNEQAKTQPRPLSAIPVRLAERLASLEADDSASKDNSSRERLDRIRKTCNSHETRLLSGVVDAQNIKTAFKDVHVAPETIEALKTLTTLSLLRPDAFKYGVLATDSLSGLMLYGPPGTGKTLLAKAVAKESKATVLEISGAQVYEKYVGEGEKMVRAVFTLAKKLSPCVVFIDEADALFGTRSSAGNRSTHREIINQFLREWDGMDDHRVFMMVASNRPFDMDDAVLRRLPRRLLVDLPLAADREKILAIHLRDESLDSAVSLSKLAEQTPLYSGSDLKNLCVAAALAAVREENELSAQHEHDSEFKLPEKRTLQLRHFDKGLQEISASISEDMSSLTAIRKFDEQYGDRKGRRKKASYGFGALGGPVDEAAARVRQGP